MAFAIAFAIHASGDNRADAHHTVATSLQAANSGKCLAVHPGDMRNGAIAYQWDCGPFPNVMIEDAGGGWHYIRFTHSGKCLTVHGFAGWNGATLDQWDCLGQTNQRWSGAFVAGAFELHSSQIYPAKCITVHQESTANGALVNQWDCLNRANQAWAMRGAFAVTPTPTPVTPAVTISGPANATVGAATGYTVTTGPVSAGQTLTISSTRATDVINVISANVGFAVSGQGTNSVTVTFTTGATVGTVTFNLTCTPATNLTLFANHMGTVGTHAVTCVAPTPTPTPTPTP